MIVNRPPVEGVCATEGDGCIGFDSLESQAGNTPMNQRTIRAFLSAYKNLGGGSQNINNGLDHFSIKNTHLNLRSWHLNLFPFQNKHLVDC